MEFFNKGKTIKLRSHPDKYLVADDDRETVLLNRDSSSRRARWTVEFVEGKCHVIRLKSCHGRYLTASDEAFLLGVTGKKVVQSAPAATTKRPDNSMEWEPIKSGDHVKLRSKGSGKYLRGNWGTPPWRNSVTHDFPQTATTQDWVLWHVEEVANDFLLPNADNFSSDFESNSSSFSSLSGDFTGSNKNSPSTSFKDSPQSHQLQKYKGLESFDKAKVVRLQSQHGKYLVADADESTVRQSRDGNSQKARWTVEIVAEKNNKIRLKSCHGLYLSATNDSFLLGMTGKKVVQHIPATKMAKSTEWEPIKEGNFVKLRTNEGNFLRANWGTPPWRNSVTHDTPQSAATRDWVFWGIEVVDVITSKEFDSELRMGSGELSISSSGIHDLLGSPDSGLQSVVSDRSRDFFTRQSSDSGSPKKSEGRIIYYRVADDDGNVGDGTASFNFRGHGLEEFTKKLEEETGLEKIIVCSRNPLNGKLYPLRLALPPNNATMNVVVVPSTSRAASEFTP